MHILGTCASIFIHPLELGVDVLDFYANLSVLFLGSFGHRIDGQEQSTGFYFLDYVRGLLSFWF